MKIKFSLLFASALALAACAPVSILNAITPASTFDKTKNVRFGEGERDIMDIYRADEPKADSPVLVFIYGGTWDSGSKDIYKFLAEGFTKSGYDIVIPDYRLYPDVIFPEFLKDNARAVASVVEAFPDRQLVLMGHSAGAYNVSMLVLRDEYLTDVGVDKCRSIAGVVGLATPVGVAPLEGERLVKIFPDRFTGKDAVLNNTDNPAPPFFLGHGESDTTVGPENSKAFAEKLSVRGGSVIAEFYPEQSHTDMVKLLSRHFDGDTTLKSDIVKFIDGLPNEADNTCQ